MNLLLILSAAVLMGYAAQRSGICLVNATRRTLKGDPRLLVAILLSGVWVWLYSILAYVNDWTLPFERYEFHPIFLIGGFMFGVGASINQGCSISTMNQLAKGQLGKMLTIMGWFLGWSIWTQMIAQGLVRTEYQKVAALSLHNTVMVSITVLFFTLIFVIKFRPRINLMIGVLCIGLLASVLFYLQPNWPPSNLLNDLGNAVLYEQPNPSLLRMGILAALLIGMWMSVAINHNAQIRWPKWYSGIRFLTAGTMMGIGAAMALGGNDTQILFGIPASSPGALSALVFMFVGIVCEQLLYQTGVMFYKRH